MRKKKSLYEKEERRPKLMISNFFSGLFLSSHILKGIFVSIFVNF